MKLKLFFISDRNQFWLEKDSMPCYLLSTVWLAVFFAVISDYQNQTKAKTRPDTVNK